MKIKKHYKKINNNCYVFNKLLKKKTSRIFTGRKKKPLTTDYGFLRYKVTINFIIVRRLYFMVIHVKIFTEYSINQSHISSLVQRVGYQRKKEKDWRIVQHNLTTALSSTYHL